MPCALYVSGMLPVYATSLSINPRAEAIVNVDLQGVRYVEMPWFIQPDHPAVMIYPQPKAGLSVESERLYAFGIDVFRIGMQLVKGTARRRWMASPGASRWRKPTISRAP